MNLRKRRCAYDHCSLNNYQLPLFKFPTDPDRKKAWLKACNREDLLDCDPVEFQQKYFLCAKHFESKHICGGTKKKTLFAKAMPTIFTQSTTENPEDDDIEVKLEPLALDNSQMLTNNSQVQIEHCYTIKTENLRDDVHFGTKTKQHSIMAKTPNISERSDNEISQRSLLKTSLNKNQPLILKKVPFPLSNTKKYNATPVDAKVLYNLTKAVGNVGNSSENPIIFKLDICKSMDVTNNIKVVKQNDTTKTTVAKRKLDTGEPNLEIPTKVQKIGSHCCIKTKPNQSTNLVGENVQKNISNQNVTAKVMSIIKPATIKDFTVVPENSMELTNLGSQAKKTEITKTYSNKKKVYSASCTTNQTNNTQKVAEPTPEENELKKVDPPINSTVFDLTENLTEEIPTYSLPSPLETANLNATNIQFDLSKCLVPECSGKKFFRVPSSPKLVFIWQICLLKTDKKRPSNPFSIQAGMVLCERHFLPEDFEEIPEDGKIGVLKEHAVPSLHPVCTGCIIPRCVNQHKNTSNMYSIPVWRKCTTWLEYLPHLRDYSHFKLLTYRVCEEHFETGNDFEILTSVPTRNLPTLEVLENLRANKLGVKLENVCAFLLCGRIIQVSNSVRFPEDYKEAMTWLELSFRNLVLQQDKEKVLEFLTFSRLCSEHYQYIKQYLPPNKKRLEFGISNVIDQLPLLVRSIEPQNDLNKVKVIKPPTTNPQYYLPRREYCAFINCATHIKYDPTIRKFKFPKDSQLYDKWKKAAGILANVNTDLSTSFVCGKHFRPKQYNPNGKLKMESVPQEYWLYKDENANLNNIHWVRKLKLTRLNHISNNKTANSTVINPQKPEITNTATDTQKENSLVVLDANKLKEEPVDIRVKHLKQLEVNTFLQSKKLQILSSSVTKPIAKCCVKNCETDATNGRLLTFPPQNQLTQKELFVKAILNKPSVTLQEIKMFNFCHICTKHFRPDLISGHKYKPNAVPTLFLNHETDTTEISSSRKTVLNQDATVVWDKMDEQTLSETQYHPRQMILQENCIEFPSIKSRLKFGKDCPKIGVNRYPFDIKHLFASQSQSLNPGHELQLDGAFIIDDDDDCERNAINLFYDTIKLNDKSAEKLINRLTISSQRGKM